MNAMMDARIDNDNEQEYQRPRRPNQDTISYLRSLPLNVAESNQQVSHFLEILGSKGSKEVDENSTEFPPVFFAAMMALIEVTNEVASLAADEQGSECLEVLAHICLPHSETCARIMLTALQGYHVFLATHRFGSHVLQTVFQLVSTLNDDGANRNNSHQKNKGGVKMNAHGHDESMDLGLHAEAPALTEQPQQLASLTDLIMEAVEEILPFTSLLAVHVCGSHVLRSLLCVLGGVQLLQPNHFHSDQANPSNSTWERRGKLKNKKKKKKLEDESTSSHPSAIMVYPTKSLQSSNPLLFQDALAKLTHALITSDEDKKKRGRNNPKESKESIAPGHLQQLACHPSAGPLLVVLLRVLTYSDDTVRCEWLDKLTLTSEQLQQQNQQRRLGLRRVEPTFQLQSAAHELVRRLLCVVDEKSSTDGAKQPYAPDVIYGLAGEARGSHVLETIMCLSHDSVYASLLEWGAFTDPSALREYLDHAVSNFCIVTLLSTIRSAEQAGQMLKALDKIIASGFIVDPYKKRRAVLWRAVEMSAKFRVGQDSLLKAIRLGFISLDGGSSDATKEVSQGDGDEEATAINTQTETSKKKRRKASAIQLQDCVRPLLGLSGKERRDADTDDGEAPVPSATSSNSKIQLDVLGTRTVYHMLRFAPRLSIDVVDGILQKIPRDELELIAKDGLGSCCIMDGILDLASSSASNDTSVFSGALKQLLKKFQGRWVELAIDRVGHHSVIKLFQALERFEDKEVLAAELVKSRSKLKGNAMGRKVMEVCLLQEYVDSSEGWKQALAKKRKREEFLHEILQDVIEKNDEDDVVVKEGRKRQRSKKNKGETSADEEAAATDGSKKSRSEAKKSATKSSVESIMEAISIPKSKTTKSL